MIGFKQIEFFGHMGEKRTSLNRSTEGMVADRESSV
jgi:hypothetical protein